MASHRLGMFDAHHSQTQPRGRGGRFVCVRHSAERKRILAKAAAMREAMGLPPLAALHPVTGNL